MLLVYLLRDADLGNIVQTIGHADIGLLLLSFMMYAVGYLITGHRLRLLLTVYDINAPVSFLIQSFMIATFFNNFLPSTVGGDLSRAYDLWKKFSSKTRAITSILLDRFLGLFALLLYTVVSVLFTREIIFPENIVYLWIAGGMLVSVLLVYMIFFTPAWLVGILDRLGNLSAHPVMAKIRNLVLSLYSFSGKKRILLYALGLSLLLQANVITQYFLVAQAMSIEIPYAAFFIIIPLATFIMMIPVSINAIGIREGVFVFFFSFYAITNNTAIAYAWVMYAFLLVQGFLGAIVFVFRRHQRSQLSQENA